MSVLDDARAAGFSDKEIQDWAGEHRDDFRAAGFSDQEIDQTVTGRKAQGIIPQPFLNRFMSSTVGDAMTEGWQAGYGDKPIIGIKDEELKSWGDVQSRMPGLSIPPWALKKGIEAADVMLRSLNAIPMAVGAGVGQELSEAMGQGEADQAKARRDVANLLSISAMLAGGHAPANRGWPSMRELGGLPSSQDFTDAARVAGGDMATTRQKMVDAFEKNGIHPTEAAADPTLLKEPSGEPQFTPEQIERMIVANKFQLASIEKTVSDPIERRRNPEMVAHLEQQAEGIRKWLAEHEPSPPEPLLSDLAKTGDPHIDAILDSTTTKSVIDNRRIDRTHDVPYGAGGSVPLEDPTVYIDKHFPREMEVDGIKFDPADPFTIHENLEQHVMGDLMKGGMTAEEAYRVAHFEYAEKAEGAWYKAMGIDRDKVEALYKPLLDKIQHDNPSDPPSNLFLKPYPHDDLAAAKLEPETEMKPSSGEIARAKAILERTRNATTPESLPTQYAGGQAPPPSGGDGFGGGDGPPRLEPPLGNGANFPGPPMVAPNKRAPYFQYDDRPGWVKFFVNVIRGYKKTFQPELISDKALQADPQFAQYISQRAAKRDETVVAAEENHQYWRTQSEADRLRYMERVERKARFRNEPPEWADKADLHQQLFNAAYEMEKSYGSKADYFENYFPHLWQDPIRAREWAQTMASQIGPKWFQKERTFNTIREGLDAGLRLKSSNPEDLVTMRILSSADMIERMDLLQRLKTMNLATETVGAEPRLAREGWAPVNAPNMEQWLIAPDIQPLWKNGVAAKGFWSNEGAPGTVFRGWMALKNVWAPVKLALSAFHPLHVLHINFNQGFARAASQIWKGGDVIGAVHSALEGIYGPVQAAIPYVPHFGKTAREAWKLPEGMRTPEQQAAVELMHDGGFVPELSEQLKINARHAFEDAKDNGQWWKAIPQGMRRAIEVAQAPIFQEWIPNLKAAAYLRDAQALLARRPELLDDPVQRRVGMRTIAKSIDNRFGEMNYGGLFWDRYVKDAGIGSFLSLGWNLGFAREFGGALLAPELRLARRLYRGETETEHTIRDAQNKLAFVAAYSSSAMLINGAMNYFMSGQSPEGLDWFLPRIGGVNPNGSPRRITNMFYTREAPMLAKHIEEKGVIAGSGDMLWNKTMFQPIKEMIDNRSYYGADIWNENGPVYQQAWQAIQHIFKENFSPMSITGAARSLNTGGTAWEAGLSMLGFGPAPSYAEKTGIENFITHQYNRYVSPTSRPQEEGEKSKTRGDIRNQILLAKQRGDEDTVRDYAQKWFKAGGSRQGLSNIMLGIGSDVAMFRVLPEAAQQAVMDRASLQEQNKYRPYMKVNITGRIADMMVDRQKAQEAGDEAGASSIDQQMQATMRKAVEDGHINDKAAFQRGLAQQLTARYAPDLSAIMGLPKRLRALSAPPQ